MDQTSYSIPLATGNGSTADQSVLNCQTATGVELAAPLRVLNSPDAVCLPPALSSEIRTSVDPPPQS